MIVYKITNLVNGKVYVGLTRQNIQKRFHQHLNLATTRTDIASSLYSAIRKYGKDRFTIEAIEECCDVESLGKSEDFWIKTLNTMSPNGYNMKSGGFTGIELTEDVRVKMGIKNIGRPKTESELEKLRQANLGANNAFYGKKHTQASIDKANRSRQITLSKKTPKEKQATALKMSMSRIGKSRSATAIENITNSVRRYHANTIKFIKAPNNEIWAIKDLKQFCKENGLNFRCINRVRYGEMKTHRGWSQITNEEVHNSNYIRYLGQPHLMTDGECRDYKSQLVSQQMRKLTPQERSARSRKGVLARQTTKNKDSLIFNIE